MKGQLQLAEMSPRVWFVPVKQKCLSQKWADMEPVFEISKIRMRVARVQRGWDKSADCGKCLLCKLKLAINHTTLLPMFSWVKCFKYHLYLFTILQLDPQTVWNLEDVQTRVVNSTLIKTLEIVYWAWHWKVHDSGHSHCPVCYSNSYQP